MAFATGTAEKTPLIPQAESNKSNSASPRAARLTARGIITVSICITNEKISSFFHLVNDKISGSKLEKTIGKTSALQKQVKLYAAYRSDPATNSDKSKAIHIPKLQTHTSDGLRACREA